MLPTALACVLALPLASAVPTTEVRVSTEIASGKEHIDAEIRSRYKSVFTSWSNKQSKQPEATTAIQCSGCWNSCEMGCMLPYPGPAQNQTAETATMSGKRTASTTSVTTSLALPNAPVTATEAPLRTTIVRAKATTCAEPNDAPHESESAQQTVEASTKSDSADPEDVTDTFYTVPLSGFHGAALPLITTNAHGEPITVIAYANASLFGNFISSSLVEELGLTKAIGVRSRAPDYLPERDLTKSLGFETYPMGVVGLDVLAGVNDRLARDVQLTVFEAPDGSGRETGGWWKADLVVGMQFLNRIQAIELTKEYTGSRDAGARHGLGVVVQRVFEVGKRGPQGLASGEHDEL